MKYILLKTLAWLSLISLLSCEVHPAQDFGLIIFDFTSVLWSTSCSRLWLDYLWFHFCRLHLPLHLPSISELQLKQELDRNVVAQDPSLNIFEPSQKLHSDLANLIAKPNKQKGAFMDFPCCQCLYSPRFAAAEERNEGRPVLGNSGRGQSDHSKSFAMMSFES